MKPIETVICRKLYLPLIILASTVTLAVSQPFAIDTREIEPLINEWNFAHQQKTLESFRRIFGEEVLFYAKNISRQACVKSKAELFRNYPSYNQSIAGPLRFVAYSSGVVKCSFEENIANAGSMSGLKKAYLLVSYDNREYKIVGESDSLSDVQAKFTLALGEPIILPAVETPSDSIKKQPEATYKLQSITDNIQNSILFSDETVEVPVRFVVIISSILLITFIMLIASMARLKKAARASRIGNNKGNLGMSKAAHLAFQRFIVTLFDPLYFSLISSKAESGGPGNGNGSYLQFRFRKNDVQAVVAISSIYFSTIPAGLIKLISAQQLSHLQHLENTSNDAEYYIVIGIGGKPEDPSEVYLVPVNEILSGNISYNDLQLYRKQGMFYYNGSARQLK